MYGEMGGFIPGDRVQVKSEYQGHTYAARVKRQGDWILDKFLSANWELRRPDDWTGPSHYPKRLRAKPHQIKLALPTPLPSESLKKVAAAALGDPAPLPPELEPEPKANNVNSFPQHSDLPRGSVVIPTDPSGETMFEPGLHVVIRYYSYDKTVSIAQLGGNGQLWQSIPQSWITVVDPKAIVVTWK